MAKKTVTGLEVTLTGTDGNIFSLINTCVRALGESDLPKDKIAAIKKDFIKDATGKDYDHAITVMNKYFIVN